MDLHEDEQVRTFSCTTRFKWSGNYGNNDHGKAQIHLTSHNLAAKNIPSGHNEARKGAQASKNGPQKQPKDIVASGQPWRQTALARFLQFCESANTTSVLRKYFTKNMRIVITAATGGFFSAHSTYRVLQVFRSFIHIHLEIC